MPATQVVPLFAVTMVLRSYLDCEGLYTASPRSDSSAAACDTVVHCVQPRRAGCASSGGDKRQKRHHSIPHRASGQTCDLENWNGLLCTVSTPLCSMQMLSCCIGWQGCRESSPQMCMCKWYACMPRSLRLIVSDALLAYDHEQLPVHAREASVAPCFGSPHLQHLQGPSEIYLGCALLSPAALSGCMDWTSQHDMVRSTTMHCACVCLRKRTFAARRTITSGTIRQLHSQQPQP
jgi:hypothetical protein